MTTEGGPCLEISSPGKDGNTASYATDGAQESLKFDCRPEIGCETPNGVAGLRLV